MNPNVAVHIVLSENVPPTWGGVARVAYNLSEALAEAGMETVLCGFDRYVTDPLYANAPFSVMPIASTAWNQRKDWIMAGLLWRIRRRYPNRQIILYALTWKLARIARLVAHRFGWRLVVFAHGLEVTKQLKGHKVRPRMMKVFLSADLCVGVSRYTADVLCRIGIPSAKVQVLNNSVDTQSFYPITSGRELPQAQSLRQRLGGEGAVLILTLARVIERKGQDSVISALARLVQRLPLKAPRCAISSPGAVRKRRCSDLKRWHLI